MPRPTISKALLLGSGALKIGEAGEFHYSGSQCLKALAEEGADGVLLSFGGQTALNCGIALADRGAFRRIGAKVLGTPLWGIRATEDRARFVAMMRRADVPTLPSRAVYSVDEAQEAAV